MTCPNNVINHERNVCMARATSKRARFSHGQEISWMFLHHLNINSQSLPKDTQSQTLQTLSRRNSHCSVFDFKMIRSFVEKIEKVETTTNVVPDDVSKGYFAVVAIKDGEIKRFVVELDYLANPAFLGLLDQAGEEYGFKQQGTLAVPCRPQELQKILDGWRVIPDNIKGAGRDIYFPKFL
ncbi:Auxin-responsive protein SAUR32 [Glycine soja]|uniref:Uncharacterized protein n=2 Tax=Glycine subgen. Soja TaxID=1462606 RepID=K7LZQ9_SOYBN|nr:Auxin-responsive protein SAUR32 [Glycine soja]